MNISLQMTRMFLIYDGVALGALCVVYLCLRILRWHRQRRGSKLIQISSSFLSEKTASRLSMWVQFLFIILATATVFFLILDNLAPFGVDEEYTLQKNPKNISTLGPTNRVEKITRQGQTVFNQTH